MTTSMLPVALPRFATKSSSQPRTSTDAGQTASLVSASDVGEVMDFDLLAEYLLDDDDEAFVFNMDSAPPSGVVTPQQNDEGALLDSLAAKQEKAKAASAPAQPKLAASSFMSAPPALGHPPSGFPVAAPPPTDAMIGTTFPTLPTPVAPLAPAMMLHNHSAAPKRRRTDGVAGGQLQQQQQLPIPLMAMGGPAPLVNGTMIPPPMPVPTLGRQKSQQQIDRRRERNRILAKRTRLRKKFFFESLQKEVTDLQRENLALKELAKEKLPEAAAKTLLEECSAMDSLPPEVQEACGEGLAASAQDFSLVKSIQRSQQCFVITDPSLQDNPIVYASGDFFNLTGYKREEVLGRNCRFLQGTETSPAKVEQLRKAIANGEDVTVTMINYTADGTAFWNKLFVAALRDADSNIVNFIGVIVKVQSPDPDDPEANKRLSGEKSEAGGDALKKDVQAETTQ